MPRQALLDQQVGFGGGLNLTADESQLGDTDLRRADNARLTVFGAIKKRLGTQRTHASAIGSGNIVRAGFSWVRTSGVVQELAVSNGLLYTGTYGIPMTWTAQVGALSSTAIPSFAAFFDASTDVAYIADGGLLNKWDGTTLTVNIASTPPVTQIAAQNSRLWGCGDASNPARLYWSDLNAGDTLGNVSTSGTGFADIRTFGQQPLTALCPLADSLLVFHPNAISVFTGFSLDDFDVLSGTRGLSSEVGTIAPKSVVTVENTAFFLSDRGPFSVSLGEGVKPIGTKIESVFSTLDQTKFARACAVHSRATREVLFYLPDIGVYAYNYRLDSWTGPWTGSYTSPVTHSMWKSVDATSIPIVLTGHSDGFVRRADATSLYKDDYHSDSTGGTQFTLVAKLRRFFWNDPFQEKALRWIYVNANLRGSQGASIAWTMSGGSASGSLTAGSGSTWGSGTWGTFIWGGLGSLGGRIQAWYSGNFADITINDDGLAESEYSALQAHAFAMSRRY